ncbi:MAG: sulfite exporter TauE/SafE family protein [Dehalococcoidales bacterium]|nr:sulfite exporter TauE/SafE family protein [Dehalococcoidales bacterium]
MVDVGTLVGFSLAAFLAAMVATMMGFGVGTSLTPIFALVYRTHVAVMLVAIVHFLTNAFRLALFRRHVDLGLIRRFGVFSIVGALVGSLAQGFVASDWLKVALGVLLITLGSLELLPGGSGRRFPRRFDQLGGLLSGLLGGLLGNQGAVRGAYLVNYDIPKEAFIATAALIAVLIDSTRIPVYLYTQWPEVVRNWPVLLGAAISAFAGTYAGQRLVLRVSQAAFKRLVNAMIVVFGVVMLAQGAWQLSASAVLAAVATVASVVAVSLGVWLWRRFSRTPS